MSTPPHGESSSPVSGSRLPGVLIDDHVPQIAGDKPFPGNLGGYRSRMFAVGYIESLIDASAPQTEHGGSTARDR